MALKYTIPAYKKKKMAGKWRVNLSHEQMKNISDEGTTDPL